MKSSRVEITISTNPRHSRILKLCNLKPLASFPYRSCFTVHQEHLGHNRLPVTVRSWLVLVELLHLTDPLLDLRGCNGEPEPVLAQ